MKISLAILWRIALTLGSLMLMASCGIEQSTVTPPPSQTMITSASPTIESLPTTAPTSVAIPSPTGTPSPTSTSASKAPSLVPSPAGPTAPPRPARLTITIADDGKTVTFGVGDRFLLDLGGPYSWQVTIADTHVLNQVPKSQSQDNQGLYEALQQGKTNLLATGTPLCFNAVPRCLLPSRLFTLHITVEGGSSSGLSVTLADEGRMIPFAVGQRFLLNLGQDFTWTIVVEGPTIVSRVANITVVQGAQGVYEAKKTGSTVLRATGAIVCPPGKACIQIAREFRVQLIVK